jgi:hypothetical protein
MKINARISNTFLYVMSKNKDKKLTFLNEDFTEDATVFIPFALFYFIFAVFGEFHGCIANDLG